MQRHIVCFFKLFTDVEKVNFTSGNHDADQRSVIGAKSLRWGTVLSGQHGYKHRNETYSTYELMTERL